MQKIHAERGYLIIAQNSNDTDYLQCARVLAHSIRHVEPQANICLMTDQVQDTDPVFSDVVEFPFGDHSGSDAWKLHNDWQCFYGSPYRQTIKLEADMIVPINISHWFDICQHKELVLTIGTKNYLGEDSDVRYYRQIFDANDLPDVYNAVTYWRRSQPAKEFFDLVRKIFAQWDDVMTTIKLGQGQPLNTDLAYAIAAKVLGVEQYTLPIAVPKMIHMKKAINRLQEEDWTRELVWEYEPGSFRLQTIQQLWPVHYHVKNFAKKLEESWIKD